MKNHIREYAKIGLVHHMLYPDALGNPTDHVKTLVEFVNRQDIETLDCCLPYGQPYESEAAAIIHTANKTSVCFATHLYPLRKLGFSATMYYEQSQIRSLVEYMVHQAATMGAEGFIFASGGPPYEEACSEDFDAFADFCRWLCGQLKPHGITALLEPFDFTIDKRFLYGPTTESVKLIESLRPEIDNLAIELDIAHLPLMGEQLDEAIRIAAPHLARVHLGNCVLRDKNHPRYGDTHPPIGFPSGEIDVPETAKVLSTLLEVGFLNPERRGCLVVEMTPWPGRTVEETISDTWHRLDQAWKMVDIPSA